MISIMSAIADWPAPLRDLATPLDVEAGETLFLRGAVPDRLFWVERGELRLQRVNADGQLIVLQRVRSGFLAEASLQTPAYHCDAWVAQDGRVWQLQRAALLAVLESDAALALWWAGRLAEQLRDARMRCERLALHGARDRVLHALDTEGTDGRLALPGTRKDWADELGLTPEALYRTLAALQRENEVRLADGCLYRVNTPV